MPQIHLCAQVIRDKTLISIASTANSEFSEMNCSEFANEFLRQNEEKTHNHIIMKNENKLYRNENDN